MTDTLSSAQLEPIPDGSYDLEFFLDPGCPFAWQTSRWLSRVAQLRDLRIGWRFISLQLINEARSPVVPPRQPEPVRIGHRVLRIAAALRELVGNDGVGRWYTAWGQRLWNAERHGRGADEVRAELTREVDFAALLESAGLPAELASAADDESFDAVLQAESDAALVRTGRDLGTPIITYGDGGPSYFGPVISNVPESDDDVLRLYDAIRTLAELGGTFSELKRTQRPPLDLPLLRA